MPVSATKECQLDLIPSDKPVIPHKYGVIVADPPWSYNDKKLNRGGAARHYSTMSLADIKAMNVADYAADDSLLFMWATGPLLPEALQVIEAWGFKYKTLGFVWVKRSGNGWENMARSFRRDIQVYLQVAIAEAEAGGRSMLSNSFMANWFGGKWVKDIVSNAYDIGMGAYVRANAELVLIGVRGKAAALIEDHGVRQILDAAVGNHSAKPDIFYDRVEKLAANQSGLELFARSNRPGWHSLGDELEQCEYVLNERNQLVPAHSVITKLLIGEGQEGRILPQLS